MNLRLSEPMPSRPCAFSLALQDDSVFADFDLDAQQRVVLVRISFDGFGCCRVGGRATAMSAADSARLIALVRSKQLQATTVGPMLSAYFETLAGVVWEDALRHHKLLENSPTTPERPGAAE
jgi:hypothetical protein